MNDVWCRYCGETVEWSNGVGLTSPDGRITCAESERRGGGVLHVAAVPANPEWTGQRPTPQECRWCHKDIVWGWRGWMTSPGNNWPCAASEKHGGGLGHDPDRTPRVTRDEAIDGLIALNRELEGP